jgi:hypothetical protein
MGYPATCGDPVGYAIDTTRRGRWRRRQEAGPVGGVGDGRPARSVASATGGRATGARGRRLGGRGPGDGSLRNRPSGTRRFPGPRCRCAPADHGRAAGIEPASKLDSVRVLEEAEIAPLSCAGCLGLRDWEYWKLPLVLQLVGQRRERGRRTKRGQRSGD